MFVNLESPGQGGCLFNIKATFPNELKQEAKLNTEPEKKDNNQLFKSVSKGAGD
jgi:hypothetical protein